MRILKITVILLSLMVASVPALYAGVTIGQKAPDFTLMDSNNQRHYLSNYQGKYVVLEWVNYDCPFTKKHYDSHNMQNLQKEYTQKGVVWLSINSSEEGKQGHFSAQQVNDLIKAKAAAPTAYLFDAKGGVGRIYGAKTTPHMFIVDTKGKVIYQGAIDDKPTPDLADISRAHNYVKAALDEVLAGKDVTTPMTTSYGCGVKY